MLFGDGTVCEAAKISGGLPFINLSELLGITGAQGNNARVDGQCWTPVLMVLGARHCEVK